jgi:methionyl-tRNA formyltransferase
MTPFATAISPLRVVMMGTGTFAEPTLAALLARPDVVQVVGLFTQPDRDPGTRSGSTRQTGQGMKPLAQSVSVPVFQPESVNTPAGVAELAGLRPDLLVVAAYGQILNRAVLATAAHGAINVHASLLPKYRGAAPVAWAIYHGEVLTGVTIIRISLGLDAGDMLAQASLAIHPDETAGELESRLAPLGANLALDVIARMHAGPITGLPQDKAGVTKAPKLTKEMGLIDWHQPAEQILRHLRAMQPWPTPYTFWLRPGQPAVRLIVARAECVPGTTTEPPGHMWANADGWHVAAGHGTILRLLEIQPAGKKRMPGPAYLHGRPLKPGDKLGKEEG